MSLGGLWGVGGFREYSVKRVFDTGSVKVRVCVSSKRAGTGPTTDTSHETRTQRKAGPAVCVSSNRTGTGPTCLQTTDTSHDTNKASWAPAGGFVRGGRATGLRALPAACGPLRPRRARAAVATSRDLQGHSSAPFRLQRVECARRECAYRAKRCRSSFSILCITCASPMMAAADSRRA